MNDDELELEFTSDLDEEVDLSVVQINLNTEYGKTSFYVPTSYSEEEFDNYVDGVFKGIAIGFEMLTGQPAVVLPMREHDTDEDDEE